MNWDAIGAIAELFGATGVIASLLYLARQMRSAAADGRRTAAQAVFTKMNTVYESVSANPQLADVYLRGTANLSALNPGEAMQFSALLLGFVRSYEELLHYKRAGAVGDWVWESVELVVLPSLTTPGGLEWWAKRRSWFTSAFQAHISNALPAEAIAALRVFEHSVEGKSFRAGVLIETESTTPLAKEVGRDV